MDYLILQDIAALMFFIFFSLPIFRFENYQSAENTTLHKYSAQNDGTMFRAISEIAE